METTRWSLAQWERVGVFVLVVLVLILTAVATRYAYQPMGYYRIDRWTGQRQAWSCPQGATAVERLFPSLPQQEPCRWRVAR